MRIWNISTGKSTQIHAGGKKNPMYAVAFDGDGVAAVGDDGRLRRWGTKDWKLKMESRVSKLPLYAVAFPPGQLLVVTAGEDRQVYSISLPSPVAP